MQPVPAVIMEMTAVDEPAVVQRPTEPIVQQAETEVVNETKYILYILLNSQIEHITQN